ncbi:MAG: HutD family protein [Beijerinckiaceae bacterium]
MRILRQSGFRVMPWKNGGGTMTDIIASPEGASLDTFDWRVSMARVVRDGPFSVFPGIDRSLTILEGEGMVLDIAGHGETLLTDQSLPFAFPGDAVTYSRLHAGPILDLNVMTRRGICRSTVTRHHTASPLLCDPLDATLLVLLRGAKGALGQERLEDGDAVLLNGTDPAVTLIPDSSALVFCMSIKP